MSIPAVSRLRPFGPASPMSGQLFTLEFILFCSIYVYIYIYIYIYINFFLYLIYIKLDIVLGNINLVPLI